MNRFENMDVFASLNEIVKQNAGFFQSDFDIDKEIITRAAASPKAEDKTLLWLCKATGTHCFYERDVFLKDTAAHNTWLFHAEQQTSYRFLAYAVVLTGTEDGKIKGNLYELDYMQHYERVKKQALPADQNKLIYENGEREQSAAQRIYADADPQLGKFVTFEALPNDPEALRSFLQEQQRSRDSLKPGDFKAHIEALHTGRIEQEARRIVAQMKGLDAPNSPNKTHFMVEVSPVFMRLASSKDTERLSAMLPYKSLTLSNMKDRHGVFAVVNRDEERNKDIRKPRPSIRAQLAADKKTAAPKKAAKTKSHDLEV